MVVFQEGPDFWLIFVFLVILAVTVAGIGLQRLIIKYCNSKPFGNQSLMERMNIIFASANILLFASRFVILTIKAFDKTNGNVTNIIASNLALTASLHLFLSTLANGLVQYGLIYKEERMGELMGRFDENQISLGFAVMTALAITPFTITHTVFRILNVFKMFRIILLVYCLALQVLSTIAYAILKLKIWWDSVQRTNHLIGNKYVILSTASCFILIILATNVREDDPERVTNLFIAGINHLILSIVVSVENPKLRSFFLRKLYEYFEVRSLGSKCGSNSVNPA